MSGKGLGDERQGFGKTAPRVFLGGDEWSTLEREMVRLGGNLVMVGKVSGRLATHLPPAKRHPSLANSHWPHF